MRRFLLLLLLFSVITTYARQVSSEEAATIASEFFSSRGLSTRSGVTHATANARGDEKASQPYYIFNSGNDNGFVIISGDDRYSKILGYADNGSFDLKMAPPQLKAMLEQFAVNAAKSTDWSATHPSWNATPFSTRADEGVLLQTATWGQGAPYNAECPDVEGVQAPTGCVATAMAIMMKYHKWPETYDWDAMPMEIPQDGENPPAANPALAKLMKDAGEAVYMHYGPYESGASMNWVGHRMQQVFKYSPECQFITAANFTNEKWLELIKESLDNANPVIYQGTNDNYTSNHAFVLDGYNSTGYHINWGWDGYCNGYYALDALTPNEAQDFSCNNGMVINIVPDKSDKVYSDCFTDMGYFYGTPNNPAIMNISVENVAKGEPFILANSLFSFMRGFNGQVGVALVDKDDNIKEVLGSDHWTTSSSPEEAFEGHTMYFFNLVANVDVDPTDRIQLVTKRDGDADYRLVLGTLEWPSYTAVANNKPKFGKVTFDIGEGVRFEYGIDGKIEDGTIKMTSLSPGVNELDNILQGLCLLYSCGPTNPEAGNPVSLKISGNLIYGEQNYSIKDDWRNSFNILGDYDVVAKTIELKDDTVVLEEAGTLKEKLSPSDCQALRKLTVSGKMNALDFWYIRNNASSIEHLDLSKVTVEAVEADDDKFEQFDRTSENLANHIPEWALAELRNLEVLILPESITGLGSYSLCSLSISSIKIPAGVDYIGLNTLFNNPNLQGVELLNPEPVFIHDCVFTDTQCPANGILFVPAGSAEKFKDAPVWGEFGSIVEGIMPDKIKYEIVSDGIKYAGFYQTATVTGYEGTPTDVVIPESITVDGVVATVSRIEERAFANCESLESVTMPNSIVEVGAYDFENCSNLKSVKLSDNLKRIKYYAFAHCGNLRACDLGENLESIEYSCFEGAGIEKVTLNGRVAPDYETISAFGSNKNLKEFVVAEGNKYFEAIDGVLYRKGQDGLVLECVPGQKEGIFELPDNCVAVMKGAITGIDNPSEVIFNKSCGILPEYTVAYNNGVKHIVLPPHAIVSPNAFYFCDNLESVTFTGNLKMKEGMFLQCHNFNNLIIDSSEDSVDLDGIFAYSEDGMSVNIFSSSLNKNFTYSDACVVYVPGRTADSYADTRAAEVKEMWRYNINRKNMTLEIVPQIEGIEIDKVTVNGKEVSLKDGLYHFEGTDNVDVKVEYTLLGHQPLTTHYTAEFNEKVPDMELSGVTEITGDESLVDVYGVDGVLYKKGCDTEDLNGLKQGVYILRQGGKSRKVVITK